MIKYKIVVKFIVPIQKLLNAELLGRLSIQDEYQSTCSNILGAAFGNASRLLEQQMMTERAAIEQERLRYDLAHAGLQRCWTTPFAEINNVQWSYLGSGCYNEVYKSDRPVLVSSPGKPPFRSFLVFKIVKETSDVTDTPERSVRIWNLLNPDFPASVHTVTEGNQAVTGWVAPFIEGWQASDSEIANKLVEIYERTGRIVTDATAPNNFITTVDGQTICIDVGLALEPRSLRRQASTVSLDVLDRGCGTSLPCWHYRGFPSAIQTIKALLYVSHVLAGYRSPVLPAIKNNAQYRAHLASLYDTTPGGRALNEEDLLDRRYF